MINLLISIFCTMISIGSPLAININTSTARFDVFNYQFLMPTDGLSAGAPYYNCQGTYANGTIYQRLPTYKVPNEQYIDLLYDLQRVVYLIGTTWIYGSDADNIHEFLTIETKNLRGDSKTKGYDMKVNTFQKQPNIAVIHDEYCLCNETKIMVSKIKKDTDLLFKFYPIMVLDTTFTTITDKYAKKYNVPKFGVNLI